MKINLHSSHSANHLVGLLEKVGDSVVAESPFKGNQCIFKGYELDKEDSSIYVYFEISNTVYLFNDAYPWVELQPNFSESDVASAFKAALLDLYKRKYLVLQIEASLGKANYSAYSNAVITVANLVLSKYDVKGSATVQLAFLNSRTYQTARLRVQFDSVYGYAVTMSAINVQGHELSVGTGINISLTEPLDSQLLSVEDALTAKLDDLKNMITAISDSHM